MKFEEKQEKLFKLMDLASKPMYNGYGIHTRVREEFPGSLRNVDLVYRGEKTPKGNPRKLPNTPKNNYKLDTAIPMYRTLLGQADEKIRKSLDRAIAL